MKSDFLIANLRESVWQCFCIIGAVRVPDFTIAQDSAFVAPPSPNQTTKREALPLCTETMSFQFWIRTGLVM